MIKDVGPTIAPLELNEYVLSVELMRVVLVTQTVLVDHLLHHRRQEGMEAAEGAEGVGVEEECPLLATDKVNPAVVVILNARHLRVVINKKVAGGAMMGDGNAMMTPLVVVPGIGQLVLHHVAKVYKAMAVELPDGAIMAPVVPIPLLRHI